MGEARSSESETISNNYSSSSSYSSSSTTTTSKPQQKKRSRENSNTKHPIYRGVRMRAWGKWVSEIRQPRKKNRIWLGTFATPDMAARAHDVAALTIKGSSAILNFPELAPLLPRPASNSPQDVQAAATKAASMKLPPPEPSQSSPPLSSSTSSTVAAEEEEEEEEELGEIVELPMLGSSFESPEPVNEFVFIDPIDGWPYPQPWYHSIYDEHDIISESRVLCGLDTSLWL
ncbi:hypothetical protein TanjilG_21803 [Lupinus angustifolius]|uniref:AP2/ERF domain-containing protein n=1 Tax=Lupinus angustifolius TaxID=3871 RepID=A0A394DBL4_LUPAN|nr:PREDICTED: ethylene-responsive transcription factor TINY-like [Lupinus angustifolius]OIW20740.1 hypothetical protein TanjilG_21803 [Lupinus angustifolius]